MLNDKRKASRRPMRYTAWIALENEELHGCVLADISDTGCKLDVENADKLPEHFMLLLSRRGFPKRRCRVVWRSPNQLGVAFDRSLAAAELSKAAPKAGVPSEAEPQAETAAQPEPA